MALEQFWIQKSFCPQFNIRAGHIVVPVGATNAHHLPTEFFGVYRPEGENTIFPCTWHETGLSFWGKAGDWRYEALLLPGLDSDRFDYVVDAIDTLSPKLALIIGAMERGIPLVSSMGAGAKTDPARMEIADISATHHCPLAHMLRKRLHKAGIRSGFTAVFSPEPVREGAVVLCEEQNKKSNMGTISYIPAVFGIGCASVVVRGLVGEF